MRIRVHATEKQRAAPAMAHSASAERAPALRKNAMLQWQTSIGNHALGRMLRIGEAPQNATVAGHRTRVRTLQLKPEQGGSESHDPAQHALGQQRLNDDASAALRVMADVMANRLSRGVAGAPQRFAPALNALFQVVSERDESNKSIAGHRRRELFEWAIGRLRPAMAVLQNDPNQRAWLDAHIMRQIEWLHASVLYGEASERVDNSVMIDNKAVEIPDDKHPREQADLLRAQLPKLIVILKETNEQIVRLGHDAIEEALEHMKEGKSAHGTGNALGQLSELQNVLFLADAWLKLNDKEFAHELSHIRGTFHGVATFSELVKAATEVCGSAVGLSFTFAAVISKLTGQPAAAAIATNYARQSAHVLGSIVAGIEIVHGIFTLIDSRSSSEQKEEAGLEVASGAAYFALGGPGSAAVVLTYLTLKLMVSEYWQAATGLNAGFLRMAFEYMQGAGNRIARDADRLALAGQLKQGENDPEKAAALSKVESNVLASLASDVDGFLKDCQPVGYGTGVASLPGAYEILREVFAPLLGQRGATAGPQVVASAAAVLEKITWCLKHAGDIVIASTKRMNLKQLQEAESKEPAQAGE